jgi:hypothetical protein
MHVHNVSSYAPPGYRLARTSYEGGATKHVFTADGQPDLVCECASQTEEAERAALAAFQGAHTPVTRAKQAWVDAHAPGIGESIRAIASTTTPGQVMRQAIKDAGAQDVSPGAPAKPSRKRS